MKGRTGGREKWVERKKKAVEGYTNTHISHQKLFKVIPFLLAPRILPSHLWRKLHLQLPAQVLPFELCIFAYIGGDHTLDLLLGQQESQAKVVHSCIVAHYRQVLHLGLQQSSNQVLRDATETKAWRQRLGLWVLRGLFVVGSWFNFTNLAEKEPCICNPLWLELYKSPAHKLLPGLLAEGYWDTRAIASNHFNTIQYYYKNGWKLS